MAGQAAKKTARNAETKSFYYFWICVIGCLINVIVNLGLYGSLYLSSLFLLLVSWGCYRMITSALEMGVGFSIWQDVFIINSSVQILSLLSIYFWILYLLVPGYGIFKFGKQIVNYVFTPKETDFAETNVSKKSKKRY